MDTPSAGVSRQSIEKELTDQLTREAPMLKKSRLSDQCLSIRAGFGAELGIVYPLQQGWPTLGISLEIGINQRLIDTALTQFSPDAHRSAASLCPAGDIAFGVTVITLQTGLAQTLQDCIDFVFLEITGLQFVPQLLQRVFTLSQQANRRCLYLRIARLVQTSASASSSSLSCDGSNSSRIRDSIASEMSGFSLRKLRTFSLPWPIRSPL